MIVSKQSIDLLAKIDAIEHDSGCYDGLEIPPARYSTPWMQEIYEHHFWSNLRDLRGEDVLHQGEQR